MCGALFISGISISSSKVVNAAKTTKLNNKNEELIVSMYDKDGISNITKVNPISKEYSELVSNQSVWLNGNLSEDKNSLVYMNALGEEPWQLFSLDLKDKKTSKLTTDKTGKFHGKAGKDNVIYFGVLDKSFAVSKIKKLNTKDNSSLIFDVLDKDIDDKVYDVRNDKVAAVIVSNSEANNMTLL